jgi:hypothetical protein
MSHSSVHMPFGTCKFTGTHSSITPPLHAPMMNNSPMAHLTNNHIYRNPKAGSTLAYQIIN